MAGVMAGVMAGGADFVGPTWGPPPSGSGARNGMLAIGSSRPHKDTDVAV